MSTNISEIANLPIDFEIGGKKLKIQRLNISEVFGYFEKVVKEQHLKNIKDIASLLDTPSDKMKYLSDATKSMPNKLELQKMAQDYLQSEPGIADVIMIGVNKCQKVSEQELVDILKNANEAEIQILVNYLFGIESDQEAPDPNTVKKNL